MKKYIILRNPIDNQYKLMENRENVTAYDMCICSNKTIQGLLQQAENFFDISPNEVEL